MSENKLEAAIARVDSQLIEAEQRARDLISFADGCEEAGLTVYAQRARVVAGDLLQVAEDLRAERSVRVSIQAERDRLYERMGIQT